MNDELLKQEILHNAALIQEYKKRLRILELQEARFGPGYVPSHISVEIDEIRGILDGFDENIQAMRIEYIDRLASMRLGYKVTVDGVIELVRRKYKTVYVDQNYEEYTEEMRMRDIERYEQKRRELDREIGKMIKEMIVLNEEIDQLQNSDIIRGLLLFIHRWAKD